MEQSYKEIADRRAEARGTQRAYAERAQGARVFL